MEAMSMADGGDETNGNVDGITLRCNDGTAVGNGCDMTVVVSFVIVVFVIGTGGGIRIVHRIHSKNSDGALSLVVLDVVESAVTKILPRLLLLVLVVVPIVVVNDRKTNRT